MWIITLEGSTLVVNNYVSTFKLSSGGYGLLAGLKLNSHGCGPLSGLFLACVVVDHQLLACGHLHLQAQI